MAKLFISYSRVNLEIVQKLRQDLQYAGIDIWIDQVGLTAGTPDWDQALRDAIRESSAVLLVASPDSRRSPYVRDEVAIAKDAKKPIYPLWVDGDNWIDSIPMGLGSTQNVDLRGEAYNRNLPRLIGTLGGQTTIEQEPVSPIVTEYVVATPPPVEPRNPYKGLRAFTSDDSGDFFGRDALIDEIRAIIMDEQRSARLLALLGPSGSGKSSIMMAGVLPRLRQDHPDWTFLDPIVPGTNPLEKLTIAVARQFENKSQKAIREDLMDRTARGLHGLACELSNRPVVLYIDQFEEIFTLVDKEAERRHFIDILTTASTESNGVLYLLLSMRADFYDRPLQYNTFGKLIESHHFAVTPMTLADLYDVVQRPAQQPDVGIIFEDGLVAEMVFAVREETAALPLLQFTLDQLFEACESHKLTLKAYHELGGIQGALARHAEATYDNLSSEVHKQLASALFLRLLEPGQTEQDTTRRRASYSELTLPDVEQTRILQETADAFVNARLLVTNQSGDYNRTIEVSHEALIREWNRLGDWLHSAREDLRLQKSLSSNVVEWQRDGMPDDMLYRGTVLADAQAWAERNAASSDEIMFINESRRVESERKHREATNQRNLRYALFGLIAVIVIASVGLTLIFAQNNADLQAEVDFSNLEIARFTTLQVADIIVPIGTQTPGIFELTATAIDQLAAHDPTLDENNQIDEKGIAMVRVPEGCFFMGSSSNESYERPVHQVCVEGFWFDKYEVTNADYIRFLQSEGYQSVEGFEYLGKTESARVRESEHGDWYVIEGYEKHPVTNVNWFAARDYCLWRGGQLPTEDQWEYAARGANNTIYPWGNDWTDENGITVNWIDTSVVGSASADISWVGAYDMIGNVREWVSSLYFDNYDSGKNTEDMTKLRTTDYRVVRGGYYEMVNIYYLRSASRDFGHPDLSFKSLGFRCAKDE